MAIERKVHGLYGGKEMSESCWNCGCNATEYVSAYANWFCSGCAGIFKEEAKKYDVIS